jgi:hypothetical protein
MRAIGLRLRRGSRAAVATFACLVMAGCACTWNQSYSSSDVGSLPWQAHARIWSHGRKAEWYVVQARGDSLSGIPVWMDMDCRRCRQVMARADIDSVQVLYPPAGSGDDGGATMGFIIGLLMVPLVVMIANGELFK